MCVYNDLAYTKQNPEVTIYYLPFNFFESLSRLILFFPVIVTDADSDTERSRKIIEYISLKVGHKKVIFIFLSCVVHPSVSKDLLFPVFVCFFFIYLSECINQFIFFYFIFISNIFIQGKIHSVQKLLFHGALPHNHYIHTHGHAHMLT